MTELKVKIGKEELKAVLEEEKAPLTCEFFNIGRLELSIKADF